MKIVLVNGAKKINARKVALPNLTVLKSDKKKQEESGPARWVSAKAWKRK